MDNTVDIVDSLRNTTYKNIMEAIGFFGLLLGLPTGGAGLIIVFPIGILALLLKAGIEVYDGIQVQHTKAKLRDAQLKNWDLLKEKIRGKADEEYLERIEIVLGELDISVKPPKEGSVENWNYLNERIGTALSIYFTILKFIQTNDLGTRKENLEALCVIGMIKSRNFRFIFQVFERTTDPWVKGTLAQVLVLLAHLAPTDLLLLFLQYVIEDYPHLQSNLTNSIIARAQDFDLAEIEKNIMKNIRGKDKVDFYLNRARYFFQQAYDFSTYAYREDSDAWLRKIVADFNFVRGERHKVEFLNAESGKLVAFACQKLGNYDEAIYALEHVLDINASDSTAIGSLVGIYESLGQYENAKKMLVQSRRHVITSEWGQNKLAQYGLA
jgi:tetratricopeptide (TPR) repeat protein